MSTATNQHEVNRAVLATAGWRPGSQGSAAPATGANAAYTVVDVNTRRVAVCWTGTLLDIRFELNAAAVATDFPLLPNVHIVFDAKKGETLNFYNTTGGSITVYCLEIF